MSGKRTYPLLLIAVAGLSNVTLAEPPPSAPPDVLPGTRPLERTGDMASTLVSGVDRFLLSELQRSIQHRARHWHRDFSSREAYERSIAPHRARLAHLLGVRDKRPDDTEPRLSATVSQPALVGRGSTYDVFAVTWPAFGDVTGEGLLLTPRDAAPLATVIAVPDCGVLPEQLAGLVPGVAPPSQSARRLAQSGCRVIVPLLVNRQDHLPQLTHREWLYRSAFELGRGLIGYEVQKLLALVDWVSREQGDAARIGVTGWGEGGLLTLYAAALDPRIDAAWVSGYFAPRENIWQEPLDRNVFGLLDHFGDAELATMVAPRPLIVEACAGPAATWAGGRGAPAELVSPLLPDVRREVDRAQALFAGQVVDSSLELIVSEDGQGPSGSEPAQAAFLKALHTELDVAPEGTAPEHLRPEFDPTPRHARQVHELDRHNQWLLRESHYVRQEGTWKRFDFSSVEAYAKSLQPIREDFYAEVIGRFPYDLLPANVRSRKFQQAEKWTAYEVVMDVFPEVIAYGLLLVPRDMQPGEKRPVVVCQHGLEGRPQHTIGEEGSAYYAAFAAALAERGFVTFAPQNLYLFEDRFRTLQRKANPLHKTLFSIIAPQHQQIVDWLQSLDFVDPERIGFYGLSYGGKTAMRVPALVTDYCLSICSADFNEWVDKNASTRNPRSYAQMGEYEIFEFDLGSTFNYAEMAALIAPRPFMVERGHFDGVADDWTVAWEYAKVRHLYAARLGIPERTTIEWFAGPHKIHGRGTFDFLHRHLAWPQPKR
jgi:dienelactone hydrolase